VDDTVNISSSVVSTWLTEMCIVFRDYHQELADAFVFFRIKKKYHTDVSHGSVKSV
jgi:hypothetical protein